MALVEVLSTLERALGLLTSSLGPLQDASIPLFVQTVSALTESRSALTPLREAALGKKGTVTESLSIAPLIGSSGTSPLSLMTLAPFAAMTNLFSGSDPATTLESQRGANLSSLAGDHRQLGIDLLNQYPNSIDRDSYGQPRMVPDSLPSRVPAQITVNVQTLDSRSFLDHSEDIAQALRRSLLTDNPLREVL